MPVSARFIEVLIVEDNPGDVQLIREGLKPASKRFAMNLRVAEDGEKAVNLLATDYRPDIILLDLNLPKINGCGVLEYVRTKRTDLASTPVVIFSSTPPRIGEVVKWNPSAYIVKPSSLTEYLKAVERFAILWLEPAAQAQSSLAADK